MFGTIWIQNVGDIDFKVISVPKNQVLEAKICWGRGNTWANGTGHTSYWFITSRTISSFLSLCPMSALKKMNLFCHLIHAFWADVECQDWRAQVYLVTLFIKIENKYLHFHGYHLFSAYASRLCGQLSMFCIIREYCNEHGLQNDGKITHSKYSWP